MKIQLRVIPENMQEITVLQGMLNQLIIQQHAVDIKPVTSKPVAAAKPATQPVTQQSLKEKEEAQPSGKTEMEIRDLVQKYVETKSNLGQVKALLVKYGAKTASELKAADYNAFYEELEAIPLNTAA